MNSQRMFSPKFHFIARLKGANTSMDTESSQGTKIVTLF